MKVNHGQITLSLRSHFLFYFLLLFLLDCKSNRTPLEALTKVINLHDVIRGWI
jgi:hypothetical protein